MTSSKLPFQLKAKGLTIHTTLANTQAPRWRVLTPYPHSACTEILTIDTVLANAQAPRPQILAPHWACFPKRPARPLTIDTVLANTPSPPPRIFAACDHSLPRYAGDEPQRQRHSDEPDSLWRCNEGVEGLLIRDAQGEIEPEVPEEAESNKLASFHLLVDIATEGLTPGETKWRRVVYEILGNGCESTWIGIDIRVLRRFLASGARAYRTLSLPA